MSAIFAFLSKAIIEPLIKIIFTDLIFTKKTAVKEETTYAAGAKGPAFSVLARIDAKVNAGSSAPA